MAPWVFRPIAQVEDPGGGGRQRLPVASCLMPDARSSRCRSSTTSSDKCPLRTTPLFREKYQLAALLSFNIPEFARMGSETVQPRLSDPLTIDPRLIFEVIASTQSTTPPLRPELEASLSIEPVSSASSFDHWVSYDGLPAPMPNPTSPTSGDIVSALARGGVVVVY